MHEAQGGGNKHRAVQGGEAKVECMVALDWDACCGSFDCRCRWQIICYLIEILDYRDRGREGGVVLEEEPAEVKRG